jgi:PAS domain S-box-containing protein
LAQNGKKIPQNVTLIPQLIHVRSKLIAAMINTNRNIHTLNSVPAIKAVKVLLVSENKNDYVLIKTCIDQSHYSRNYILEWCDNYEKAINAMLKKYYELYLINYKLGEHTGLDLLHEAICSNCTEPIIMLSEEADIKSDQEALRIGATDYLIKKNMDGHTLERSMRYALEHSIALKNLKGNENKFRTIFEKSIYPIIISDHSGIVYDANPAAVKFFELPLEKLLNENTNHFYSEKERADFANEMEQKGSISDFEVNLRIPNGKIKFCSISSFVQIPQHGSAIYYHSIIQDLTARKEHESTVAERIAISEQFAKSLANEIQHPLSNVNVALEGLSTTLNGNKSESVQKYLEIVKENCDRIDKLTKNIFESVNQSLTQ